MRFFTGSWWVLALASGASLFAYTRFCPAGSPSERQVVTPPAASELGSAESFIGNTYSANVYDCAAYQTASGYMQLANTSHILEDISFSGGPYGPAYAGERDISSFRFAYKVPTQSGTWDTRFTFYSPSDATFSGFSGPGTAMINPNAVPIAVVQVTGFTPGTACPGVLTFRTIELQNHIDLPSGVSGVWVDAAFLVPGTPVSAPLTSANLLQTSAQANSLVQFAFGTNTQGANPAGLGFTASAIGADINFDGIFTGQVLINTDEVQLVGTALSPLGFVFALNGQLPAPPPPNAVDIDAVMADRTTGVASYQGVLTPASPVRWYRFTAANGFSFASNTFLDIDTEGSASPSAFAVYDGTSAPVILGVPRGDGPFLPKPSPGNNYQVSFGVPGRPAVGNGEACWGQEGDLAAGTYWIAVAPEGSVFSGGWAVTAATGFHIAYSLNFNSNDEYRPRSDEPPTLTPSLAPDGDLGILSGAHTSGPIEVTFTTVGWLRFTITNPIPTVGQVSPADSSPLSDVTYLDISQPGSAIDGQWNLALYNESGHLFNANSISRAGVGYNGNYLGGDGPWTCGGSFAQLSYGIAPSRGPAPLDSGQTDYGIPLANQNGAALPAGTYYLAITMGQAHFHDTRFGARNTRDAHRTARITIASNCRGPSLACPADLNGDGAVDDSDFVIFATAYNNLTDLVGDLNADLLTDDSDFVIFASAYDALLCP